MGGTERKRARARGAEVECAQGGCSKEARASDNRPLCKKSRTRRGLRPDYISAGYRLTLRFQLLQKPFDDLSEAPDCHSYPDTVSHKNATESLMQDFAEVF